MRFVIAAMLFILSVVALLIGVAQRTVWAPPTSYSMGIELESVSSYVVIPAETIALHPGNPVITASGSETAFVASGRESDIRAWIGTSPSTAIELSKTKKSLEAIAQPGGGALDSPVNSDLWRAEQSNAAKASLRVQSSEQGAALIASDGVQPAPTKIKILWQNKFDPTQSNIFIITGLVMLAVAAVLNFLAYRKMRINRGPRRRTPKAPRGPQYKFRGRKNLVPQRGRRASGRSFSVVAASAALIGLVSGCASDATSSPTPSSSANLATAPVSLLAPQINKILRDVAQVAADADQVNDKRVLANRFTGPAFDMRSTNYILRTRNAKIAQFPAVVASPIKFDLPAATDVWPRTAMIVTDERGDAALPQMLVLQQETPRSDYLVWYVIRLLPGAEIPAVPSARVGAIPVDKESLFLKMKPNQIGTAFGDLINNGPSSLSASLFNYEKDEFYKQVSSAQRDQAANLTTGKITFGHILGNENVISLATSNSGALVAVYMKDVYTIKPKKRNAAVAVSGLEKVLLGASGSTTGVQSVYGDMLLFYVPAIADDSRIDLLGVSQGLLSVKGL